ncbi:MAG: hypothetical protein AVDCRST_MAG66-1910, partial [uncultured Pseudonocardia sp.]
RHRPGRQRPHRGRHRRPGARPVPGRAGQRGAVLRPLARRGPRRARPDHRRVRRREPRRVGPPGHQPVQRLPVHRTAADPPRRHRGRVHRVPRRAVRRHGRRRALRRPVRAGVHRQLPAQAGALRPGRRRQPAGSALPVRVQHAAGEHRTAGGGRGVGGTGGLGRLPRPVRGPARARRGPDRVAGRRAGQRRAADQLDGDEQRTVRRHVHPDRGRDRARHRRLVPRHAAAVRPARAVLPGGRAGRVLRAVPAAVRHRWGRDARHRHVPPHRGAPARRGLPDRPGRPDHRGRRRRPLPGRGQRDVRRRGVHGVGAAGGGRRVRRVPVAARGGRAVRQRHGAALHGRGRRVHRPRPAHHEPLADRGRPAGAPLPVREPRHPLGGGERVRGGGARGATGAGRRGRPDRRRPAEGRM